MDAGTYDLIYIITNIFGTYIIFKFMMVFFERPDANRRIEIISYIGYFFVISSVYLYVKIPVVMMVFNILAFFLISLNYKSSIKKRILAVALIYFIMMCVEVIIIQLLSGLKFNIFAENKYSLSYSLIVLKLATYVIVLVLNKYKTTRQGEQVPVIYWVCILLIPIGSMYIVLLLFRLEITNTIFMIIAVAFMLLINFSTFYLYDIISAAFANQAEKLWAVRQNKYYERQFDLMKSSLKAMRSLKHDLKNHLSTVYYLVQNRKEEEALEHITDIIEVCDSQKENAYSGNATVDSIINFKLQEAKQHNISISLDITIPENIKIPSFDMAIILGNLLDNAINAAAKSESGRTIDLKIKYTVGRLILVIDNLFSGNVLIRGNTVLSSHRDINSHGIGLQSVKMVLQKYNGSMVIKHENNIFSVTVLMYID